MAIIDILDAFARYKLSDLFVVGFTAAPE